jgi:hypothetical protein
MTAESDDDILDDLFHNAECRILPNGASVLGPLVHVPCPFGYPPYSNPPLTALGESERGAWPLKPNDGSSRKRVPSVIQLARTLGLHAIPRSVDPHAAPMGGA